MNAHDIETLIAESLNLHAAAADADRCADVPDGIEELFGIRTFAEVGVLTSDAGLVLRLDDASEWQVTIVRSN